VINTGSGESRSQEPPLGPRRGTTRPTDEPMSRSKATLLDTVTARAGSTLADLAATTGLHVNTVREHLEALEQRGLVQRERAAPRGRGRPAWRYRPVEPSEHSEYAGLATALAATIHRSSERPRDDAVAAGAEWGRDLARAKGDPAGTGPAGRRRQVVALLADIGFAPETKRTEHRRPAHPLPAARHCAPAIPTSSAASTSASFGARSRRTAPTELVPRCSRSASRVPAGSS
jgi:predicted ArsR family transcriptional regulator